MQIDVTVIDMKGGGDGLVENRPSFKEIKSFEEFNQYYWYREELSQICKSLGLEYRGTKKELLLLLNNIFREIK